jgi:MFS family permease
MRTRAYWIIAIAMTTNALVGTAFVFLLRKLASDIGLGEGADDRLLGVFGVSSIALGLGAGVMTDRLPPRWVVGTASALLGLTCAAFALAGAGPVREVQALVVALAWGSMVLLSASQSLMFVGGSTLFARFFGRPHHGAIRASLTFFMVSGTSAGPFLTAAMAQGIGYQGALWAFAAACVPIAAAGLTLTRPQAP